MYSATHNKTICCYLPKWYRNKLESFSVLTQAYRREGIFSSQVKVEGKVFKELWKCITLGRTEWKPKLKPAPIFVGSVTCVCVFMHVQYVCVLDREIERYRTVKLHVEHFLEQWSESAWKAGWNLGTLMVCSTYKLPFTVWHKSNKTTQGWPFLSFSFFCLSHTHLLSPLRYA